MVKFSSDIDIDVADRDLVLKHIRHTKAMQLADGKPRKHNSGVYVTPIPFDALTGLASIDYHEAETRGYVKIDLLNMSVYSLIKDQNHYAALLKKDPPWHRLLEKEFCEKIVHIGSWHNVLVAQPEPVDSIPRLAMFLAAIRPGKKHLLGKPWKEVAMTIWDKSGDGEYAFKKSHGVAYSHLVALHMNLINETG